MDAKQAIAALGALAHDTRLAVFRMLVQRGPEGLAAGGIAETLGMPPSSLTFHLQQLSHAGLVTQRRVSRQVFYAADFTAMNRLLGYLTDNCCGGGLAATGRECVQAMQAIIPDREEKMNTGERNVLFLCTGNSARSILAEALIDHHGGGRLRGFSAGSTPRGAVHPLAVQLLAEHGLRTDGLRSKPWDEFAAPGAPVMDFVFTVCDQAAGESCPVWPGQPITAHWGIPDPAAVEGSPAERMLAFREAFRALETRIRLFTALPIASLDRLVLSNRVAAIGRIGKDSPAGESI